MEEKPVETTELGRNVYACLMAGETANAGFLVTKRGVVVVDTFDSPARGRELAATIEDQTNKPILFVVNTHFHFDHVLGNQAFDAPVIAHCALAGELARAVAVQLAPEEVADWIAEHPEDRWLADELDLVYPNVVFDSRLVLDLPPLLVVIRHLGGHTLDSSIVDLPDEGILFAGDLVFEGRVPYLLEAHFGETIKALRHLETLGDRTIVPGHGELCNMAYIAQLRTYVESLRNSVAELIDRGWEKSAVVDSDQLPRWWTDDRPDLVRANTERLYDELAGGKAFL